jgi:hypothetical protein
MSPLRNPGLHTHRMTRKGRLSGALEMFHEYPLKFEGDLLSCANFFRGRYLSESRKSGLCSSAAIMSGALTHGAAGTSSLRL